MYLAEAHPTAFVFDSDRSFPDGLPGYFLPYFHTGPMLIDNPLDYMDPAARHVNSGAAEFIHPLGDTIGGLLAAGLRLEWFREHDAVTWKMFACLVEDARGLFRWPGKRWLPLAYSLRAIR